MQADFPISYNSDKKMTESVWKKFFLGWPADMPRRGILVTAFGDQIPFAGFMTSEALLLIERATPDAVGAAAWCLPTTRSWPSRSPRW